MGKIYGENLWGKFMGKNYWEAYSKGLSKKL
jgi:hypothetical protein